MRNFYAGEKPELLLCFAYHMNSFVFNVEVSKAIERRGASCPKLEHSKKPGYRNFTLWKNYLSTKSFPEIEKMSIFFQCSEIMKKKCLIKMFEIKKKFNNNFGLSKMNNIFEI